VEAKVRELEMKLQAQLQTTDAEAESPGFEGPEKRLEINLRENMVDERGLRSLPKAFWDECMSKLDGSILAHMKNDHWDVYIITESSLFVSKTKVIVLTCGTTTLLQCVNFLLAGIANAQCEVEWFQFSRKNYTYPSFQKDLHKDFTSETRFLRNLGIYGDAHVLGPISQDHYYFFAADHIQRATGAPEKQEVDQDMVINMYDIDPQVSRLFWMPGMCPDSPGESALPKADQASLGQQVTKASGIRAIFPEAKIQERMFEPCGYSMNGIEGNAYHTIHITPESHCSYASFETNAPQKSFKDVISKVITTFKPDRFTIMFFADKNSPIGIETCRAEQGSSQAEDLNPRKSAYWAVPGYQNKCLCFHEFEPGYFIVLANYQKAALNVPPSPTFASGKFI